MTATEAEAMGYKYAREIPAQGLCGLMRFMFTVAIVCDITDTGYSYRYCFDCTTDAYSAFEKWDGKGHPGHLWIKRKGQGGDLSNPVYVNNA